jgi:predicted NBD/HSP70 family sugar kinase
MRGAARPPSEIAGDLSQNERVILALLRREGPSAKARIAERTGLSAQTASVLTRRLEQRGLIARCEPVRGRVGQPSVPMRLAPRGALFFGLKVGRRSADLCLVDFLGRIVDRARVTYAYPDPDDAIAFARRSVETVRTRLAPDERARIGGLGVSMPGYLWEWVRQVGAPPAALDAWRERDFRAEVAGFFDFPVFLQNDASCACGAELTFGVGAFPPDFLYVYVGHFIGGGLVLNGRLQTGPTGNAAALGPMPVPAPEGGLRQLVDVASLHGLERDLAAAGRDATILWDGVAQWDIPDGVLDPWLDRAAGGLAFAFAAATSVVDVEAIVIDGWLPRDVRRILIDRVETAMAAMNWSGLVAPGLHEGTIGPEARSIGAATLPLSAGYFV